MKSHKHKYKHQRKCCDDCGELDTNTHGLGSHFLSDQILRDHISVDNTSDITEFKKQNKYECNASVFDNLMKLESLSVTTANPRPNGSNNIHINARHTFCGGQQVMGFMFWNFDQMSNFGRICCDNSVWKQSMNDLSFHFMTLILSSHFFLLIFHLFPCDLVCFICHLSANFYNS